MRGTSCAATAALLVACLSFGCGEEPGSARAEQPAPVPDSAPPLTLHVAAFTTVREAYEKRIIPLFVEKWRRDHGQELRVVQSYGASAVQAQAIVDGWEADVAALSNAEDVELLVRAELVRPDWPWGSRRGIVSTSAIVLAVRNGNPRGIRDWDDLVRPGLKIVLPDPTSSGGGRWSVAAIYGSVLRGAGGGEPGTPAQAERALAGVLRNVVSWSPDARSSFQAFEDGLGDVAITSESEVVRSRTFGHEIDWVVPRSTLRTDNPAVLVDANADQHGVREAAQAFLEHLVTEEAQRAFALRGSSAVPDDPEPAHRAQDLWGIEDLGGWERIARDLLAPGAGLDRAKAASRED
jgi:sulfate transport system substrate-binding protein